MRIDEERLARLALIWSEAVGPAGLARLISYFGSATAVLTASKEELGRPALKLRPQQVDQIATLRERLGEFEQLWSEARNHLIRVIFDDAPEYPTPLVDIPNRPPVLSIYGNWLRVDDPAVAIVGTRSPTEEGVELAGAIAAACARQRVTVVSGLARGIDEAAHKAAIRGGGRTLGVVGSGILALAGQTAALAREVASRGALISELAPFTPASSARLIARNRIISGLARVVVVVQSRSQGGAMHAAEYALRQGRVLCAVRWPDDVPQGKGPAQLISKGAVVVSSPEDVLEVVERVRRGAMPTRPVQPRLLNTEE